MSKTKNKPGIHLLTTPVTRFVGKVGTRDEFYWHIVASNGRIIARSSETYSRKAGAVKSIKIVARILYSQAQKNGFPGYYDHTKPNSPLQSYL
jgi:uncharacterized protein YegP (UPF0339 family)